MNIKVQHKREKHKIKNDFNKYDGKLWIINKLFFIVIIIIVMLVIIVPYQQVYNIQHGDAIYDLVDLKYSEVYSDLSQYGFESSMVREFISMMKDHILTPLQNRQDYNLFEVAGHGKNYLDTLNTRHYFGEWFTVSLGHIINFYQLHDIHLLYSGDVQKLKPFSGRCYDMIKLFYKYDFQGFAPDNNRLILCHMHELFSEIMHALNINIIELHYYAPLVQILFFMYNIVDINGLQLKALINKIFTTEFNLFGNTNYFNFQNIRGNILTIANIDIVDDLLISNTRSCIQLLGHFLLANNILKICKSVFDYEMVNVEYFMMSYIAVLSHYRSEFIS